MAKNVYTLSRTPLARRPNVSLAPPRRIVVNGSRLGRRPSLGKGDFFRDMKCTVRVTRSCLFNLTLIIIMRIFPDVFVFIYTYIRVRIENNG